MLVRVSPKFIKSYRRLPEKIKKQAKEKQIIFKEDPFDCRLKLHKLAGKQKEY
ncbi:MAG: hypothetical protein V1770_01435 [bacterium]